MASEVDICNLALSHLGDGATVATISPPDGSAQADHCARFYPIARNALLEMHPWSFSTIRTSLALASTTSTTWQYCYIGPSDALNYISILDAQAGDDYGTIRTQCYLNGGYPQAYRGYGPQDFAVETDMNGADLVYTDQPNAVLRYTRLVTDTTRFTPLFTTCLGWLLASDLAGPILKGDTGAQAAVRCHQMFERLLSAAIESDANQRQSKPGQMVQWIARR